MLRIDSPWLPFLCVQATTGTRSRIDRPIRRNRGSSARWPASGPAKAPGPAKAFVASLNHAPCSRGFAAAFFGPHSKAHLVYTELRLARSARDVRQGCGDPVTPGFPQREAGHALKEVSRHGRAAPGRLRTSSWRWRPGAGEMDEPGRSGFEVHQRFESPAATHPFPRGRQYLVSAAIEARRNALLKPGHAGGNPCQHAPHL